MSEHGTKSTEEHEKPASRPTKHRQVFEHVLADINSGRLKDGERLPSEIELVEQFATSRPTVARALRDLQNLGLVERKVGSGTYVRRSQKPADSWRFGLLIPGLGSTEIFEPICGQLARLAQRQHHTLLWGDFGDKRGVADPELIEQVCTSYVRQTVAGVFFAPLELTEDKDRINQSVIAALEAAGIPIVLLDRDIVAFPAAESFRPRWHRQSARWFSYSGTFDTTWMQENRLPGTTGLCANRNAAHRRISRSSVKCRNYARSSMGPQRRAYGRKICSTDRGRAERQPSFAPMI